MAFCASLNLGLCGFREQCTELHVVLSAFTVAPLWLAHSNLGARTTGIIVSTRDPSNESMHLPKEGQSGLLFGSINPFENAPLRVLRTPRGAAHKLAQAPKLAPPYSRARHGRCRGIPETPSHGSILSLLASSDFRVPDFLKITILQAPRGSRGHKLCAAPLEVSIVSARSAPFQRRHRSHGCTTHQTPMRSGLSGHRCLRVIRHRQ